MPDFSQIPVAMAVWCFVYFLIVAVHECGHYLAGLLIGIPSRCLRIRLFTFPQHVALRDGDGWVGPQQMDRYLEIAVPLMPTRGRALAFVAGGFVLEIAALLIWVVLRLPFFRLAVWLALIMTVFYVIADVAIYLRTRKASLDFSAMCSISPVLGTLIAVVVVGLQFYLVTLL